MANLGPELVTNGEFTSDLSSWNYTGGVTWTNSPRASAQMIGSGNSIDQTIDLVAGKTYLFEFDAFLEITGDNDPPTHDIGWFLTAGHQDLLALPWTGEVVHFSETILITQQDIDYVGPLVGFNGQGSGPKQYVTNVSVKEDFLNLYVQITQMVGAETSDVQTINAGKSDDSTPIYYELETQGLEFGNVFHRKKISDKIVVFTKDGIDSTIQGKTDNNDYQNIQINLSNRVNIGQKIDLEGNTVTFKWFGEASETSPVLEGFYLEKVTDMGITHG